MSKFKSFFQNLAGKGYYIALGLCVVAIGLTGWLYYRNTKNVADEPKDAAVSATIGQEVEAGAPAEDPTEGTGTTKPTRPTMKTGMPVSGETLAGYAMDCLGYNATTRDWRVHNGIDIAAEAGTPVCAAADGEVYTVFQDEAMGTTVVLRHQDGYVTTYSSLDEKVEVSAGDQVTMGQTIGTVGNSAPLETAVGDHVHFSVSCNDIPMDPADFL